MAQIKRFGVIQTAKFSAALYFAVTAVMMIPIGLMILATDIAVGDTFGALGAALGMGVLFVVPFVYAIVTFAFVAIGCLLYNGIAHCVGGVEVEMAE